MAEALEITTAEIEAVAEKLNGMDGITDREREVLGGVFFLAGRASAADAAEVSGFMPTAVEKVSINFTMPGINKHAAVAA